jgi:hypothetical protein
MSLLLCIERRKLRNARDMPPPDLGSSHRSNIAAQRYRISSRVRAGIPKCIDRIARAARVYAHFEVSLRVADFNQSRRRGQQRPLVRPGLAPGSCRCS